MPYSVGKSSYPDLRGAEQFVATAEIAAQVASLCYEFDTQVAKGGDRLTVNEGIRSHERQDYLYDQYLHHGGALAATPYTSTHDATRGSALDFGITRPDGSNRALTQAEFDWLHARAPQRGIRWTGAGFARVEQWHHNGGYAASVAPIPGVNLPGEAIGATNTPKSSVTPTTLTTPVGDIVSTFIVHIDASKTARKGVYDSYLVNPDTMKVMHILTDVQETFWKNKGLYVQPGIQAPQVIANFEKVGK